VHHTNDRILSRYRFRHIQIQKYLYSSLDEVERVHLHQQVGSTLEELYTGQDMAAIAPQLAHHFQEAQHTQKAIHYLQLAGQKAVQLSAYQEGVKHLTNALSLLMTQPESAERDEQELELQLSLGMAFMTYIPGPEWNRAYTRARELCRQTDKTSQLCHVLGELSIFHYVRCEHPLALELAEETYNLSQQDRDPRIAALGSWYLGLPLFATGNYTAARAHFAQVTAFYEPRQHHQFYVDFRGSDPGLSALAYDALCLWCLGYPEQAIRRSHKALNLAHELVHPFTLADVLCYAGCIFNIMVGNATAVQHNARQLIHIAQDTGFAGWLGTASVYWGEGAIMQGRFEEGIRRIEQGEKIERLSTHIWCYSAGILGALAWAYAQTGRLQLALHTIDEALIRVEQADERHWEANLRRLRAEILLIGGDEVKAEASLQQAIGIARQQRAKSWELRAVISLARLWHQQGKSEQARRRLAQIYNWFTEGHDTADLREAKTLLKQLNRQE
jgi:predicted ATPase